MTAAPRVGSVLLLSLVLALGTDGAQGRASESLPPAPDTPTVYDNGLYALTVEWVEPESVDPPVTGYDIQYRHRDSSSWLSGPQDQTGTTATITDLDADKNYYVQVRAQNTNGEGAWSVSGEGTTALYVGTLTAKSRARSDTYGYLGYRSDQSPTESTRRANSFGELVPRSVTYDGTEYQIITLAWCRCSRPFEGDRHTTAIDLYTLWDQVPDEWLLRAGDLSLLLSDAERADLGSTGLKAFWPHIAADWVFDGEYEVSFSRNPLLSTSGSGTIRGPLTAEMLEVPTSHNGIEAFQFKLSFSEDVANGEDDITGAVLTVAGGSVSEASQVRRPSHREWWVKILPSGAEDISITLQADRECDVSGAVCTEDGRKLSQTVMQTVVGPEPPVITGQTQISVAENGTGHVARFTASDPDTSQLTWQSPTGVDAAAFTVDSSGNLRFLASPDFEAPTDDNGDNIYEVTVRVSDGLQVATHYVAVTVTDQNDRPMAVDDRSRTSEDQPVTVDVLDNDSDPDDGDTLTLRVVSVHNGTARIERDRAVVYTPRKDYHGNGRFQYEIRDSAGMTARASAEIEIEAVNDPPTFRSSATGRTVAENAREGHSVGAPVRATDIDGDTLTYRIFGSPEFAIQESTGQIKVAANAEFDRATLDSYVVTVEADDGNGGFAEIDVTVSVVPADTGGTGGGGGGGGGGSGGGGGGGAEEEAPPGASSYFTDIEAGTWYEAAVTWMVDSGITQGCTTTAFCPDLDLTRQQFVTFLWRAAGQPTPVFLGSQAFSDVPAGVYSDQAIGWAVSNEITLGCTPGRRGDPDWRFCPTRQVTRGQMATLLYRHVEADYVGQPTHYTDVAPEDYFSASVSWLTDFVVAPGCDLRLFCPNRAATRAEAALFINGVALRPHIWGEGNTAFTPQPQ